MTTPAIANNMVWLRNTLIPYNNRLTVSNRSRALRIVYALRKHIAYMSFEHAREIVACCDSFIATYNRGTGNFSAWNKHRAFFAHCQGPQAVPVPQPVDIPQGRSPRMGGVVTGRVSASATYADYNSPGYDSPNYADRAVREFRLKLKRTPKFNKLCKSIW